MSNRISAALFSNIVTNVDILSLFDIDGEIKRLEKQFGVTLAAAQNEAVKRAVTDGVLIVTGGPGTGKTTILKFVIEIMEHLGLQIELAAPTGRASKRISDTTGREERTLHRLLEYNFNNNSFNRNADYPVEADVIIIDEMSMVDVMLFHLPAESGGQRHTPCNGGRCGPAAVGRPGQCASSSCEFRCNSGHKAE